MTGTALLLLVLLLSSAFFSGAEIALFSLNEARVRALVEEQRRGAEALLRMKQNPERLLTTILVGNNIANIGSASLATALALDLVGDRGVAVATGVMTVLVLIFGEITPKSLAAANAEAISLSVAPVLSLLSRVLAPIVIPVETLTRWVVQRRSGEAPPRVTEGEIREMAAIGHREGAIEDHERRLVERAFTLDERTVWDVMTPRVDMVAWPADRRLQDIASELKTTRFSRVPVYRGSIDQVVGVLYVREAYQALVDGRDLTLGELAREPILVPGSLSLIRLLALFQGRRTHLGIVIDEYGGTDGLVTLEDVLEELVGEIEDETDLAWRPIIQLNERELIAEGSAEVREINEILGTSLSQEETRSINGFLLEELDRVPQTGEEIVREGVRIRVLEAVETQVLRVKLELEDEATASP